MEPFLGEIRMFAGTYAPQGWALCAGQPLPVKDYEALYSLIGNLYGGDQITFNMPDLRGRIAIGQGQGTGLTNRVIGSAGGTEAVALTAAQTAPHTHTVYATDSMATAASPSGALLAQPSDGYAAYLHNGVDPQIQTLNAGSVASFGGSNPHENRMPSLALTYIIATQGLYPQKA